MGLFTDVDQIITEVFHDLQHVQQGEGSTVTFEKLTPGTNAIEDLIAIDSFEYDERSIENRALPPDVQYEMRISEAIIEASDLIGCSSVRHATPQGTVRYQIVRPSPFWPSGFNRVWRFWLMPAEVVSIFVETFNLVDDAGDNLVDDAGNQIVAI